MANSTMLAILFFALVPFSASAADESCAAAGNCVESVEFDNDGGLDLLQKKAAKQLKAEAVAHEHNTMNANAGLELAQTMKMYAKTRNDITSEGAKALAHLRWGSGFMKSVCSLLESASAESSLLQGVKSLVGISKLQEDYAQMCKTVISGENACASRAEVVVNLPNSCGNDPVNLPSGGSANCASVGGFAQTLRSDAKTLDDYLECAADSARSDLQAYNKFVGGASGLGSSCTGACPWLTSFSPDTTPLKQAMGDFDKLAIKTHAVVHAEGLNTPTVASLTPLAKQIQDIVDGLDKAESNLMSAESENCKKGASHISKLPASLTSEASSLMNDCSSNCASFAAMLGR
jgi:hypothetical protein